MRHWDWGELIKLFLAAFFLAVSGVLLALVGGWLAIRLVFEILTSYAQ